MGAKPKPRPDDEAERLREQTAAMNRELVLSAVRQHELLEVTEKLNAELQAEIAERRRAEEALSASELRYRRLFESAKDGILLLDADKGTVYDVNPCLVEMLGYSREEMVGKKLWEISPIKDAETAKDAFKEIIIKGQARHENLPVETRDGRIVEVEVVSSVYRVNQTRVIQCNLRDITDKKNLERARADFLSMLTHDLKSPLTAILGYSDLLLCSQGELGAEKAEMVKVIQRSSEKIMRMVEDLLSFSRLETRKVQLDLMPENIHQLLEKVATDFMPAAEQKGIKLETDFSGVPLARVDLKYIERSVGNLLQNAINFTPAGGRVVLKAESGHRDGGRRHGPYLAISVIDTGPGITEEDKGRIFDIYFTSSRKSGKKGTGLGLTIVKAVAEAHGGRVTVESESGKGSTFHIYLPIKA